MKSFLAGILAVASMATFAHETDYTCSLSVNGEENILKVNALISRGGISGNPQYYMVASNSFGYELEVFAVEKSTDKRIVYGKQKLNPMQSHLNPKKIQFKSADEISVIDCVRADNIVYPKG